MHIGGDTRLPVFRRLSPHHAWAPTAVTSLFRSYSSNVITTSFSSRCHYLPEQVDSSYHFKNLFPQRKTRLYTILNELHSNNLCPGIIRSAEAKHRAEAGYPKVYFQSSLTVRSRTGSSSKLKCLFNSYVTTF